LFELENAGIGECLNFQHVLVFNKNKIEQIEQMKNQQNIE
jgi:hypothetical protein